jgi:hypothetical protein
MHHPNLVFFLIFGKINIWSISNSVAQMKCSSPTNCYAILFFTRDIEYSEFLDATRSFLAPGYGSPVVLIAVL